MRWKSRVAIKAGLAAAFLTAAFFSGNGEPAARADDSKQPLDVTLAAIWEGEPATAMNRDALVRFRQNFTSLKMVHFISPAYFTRASKDPKSKELEKRRVLESFTKDDIAGLYLNGWKSIMESAGVSFRSSPTFWGNILTNRQCLEDCGREVAMTAYQIPELRKIIRKSRTLFAKNGFGSATFMQVAGYAAGPDVLAAARAEGITHDFSAVAADLLAPRLYRFPLRKQLTDLWGGVGPLMKPFELETGSGKITQMTANGLHLEFMSEQEIAGRLDELMGPGIAKATGGGSRHLFIGVPVETFAITAAKLEFAMGEIIKRSSESGIPLRWTAETIAGADTNRPPQLLQTGTSETSSGDTH